MATPAARRYTTLPREGRPSHAVSDGYPLVVNSKDGQHLCVECQAPCDEHSFLYGRPDCGRRSVAAGDYDDGQARFEAALGRRREGADDGD